MHRTHMLKLWVLAAQALCCSAFPLYTTVNGTVVISSAFGGNVELAPDAGGVLHRPYLAAKVLTQS